MGLHEPQRLNELYVNEEDFMLALAVTKPNPNSHLHFENDKKIIDVVGKPKETKDANGIP